MKIRCVIDRIVLDGMALGPAQRVQLERALHAQLQAALRAGWLGASGVPDAAWPRQLRIDLAPPGGAAPAGPAPGQSLGHALGQSLGAALSPAGAGAGPASDTPGSR